MEDLDKILALSREDRVAKRQDVSDIVETALDKLSDHELTRLSERLIRARYRVARAFG